jgi:hypothetical protein
MTMRVSPSVIGTAVMAAACTISANALARIPAQIPAQVAAQIANHGPAPTLVHDRSLMTVQGNGAEPGQPKRPGGPLNSIAEVFAALEACWIPPALDRSRVGMQITVMLSFKRNGELLGKPRITYETPSASDDERMSYRVAMAQAVARCMPLQFTDALGNALAGRPITIRFIDNRKLQQAETAHDREC